MILTLTLNQMLSANLHIGHTLNTFNSQVKGILLGLRKKKLILDLSLSIFQIQIISNFIIGIVSKRHPVLLIKQFDYFNLSDYIKKNWVMYPSDIVVHDSKWVGGTLTNHKFVLTCKKFKSLDFVKLRNYNRFPSLVCLFDANYSQWAFMEAYNLSIPISSLISSDSIFFKLVNYPFISNNRNINSFLFYVSVICNSITYAKKKEVSRILNLSNYLRKETLLRKNVFFNIWDKLRNEENLKKKYDYWYSKRKTIYSRYRPYVNISVYSATESRRKLKFRKKRRWKK